MADLEGIDVSHQQGAIDWKQVKDAGIAFAFIKATEGVDFPDDHAQAYLTGCREVGIVAGMYHFYHHDDDPEEQAAYFLKHLTARAPGDLIPAIDIETEDDGAGPAPSPSEVVRRIEVMVRAVQEAIGRAPMIYTYPSAWTDLTGSSTAFASECPLWIASYRPDTPALTGGWKEHTVWQYAAGQKVQGISAPVDRDRFNGGAAQMAAFRFGALTKGGKAVFNQDGVVRGAPGVNSPQVGVLRGGTAVAITDGPQPVDGIDWWKIDNGAGTAGWSSSKVLSPA